MATGAEVLALADAVPTRYRALVLTAVWSGARWGELVALTRDRLDLLHGMLTIDRQLVELLGSRLAPDTPKTAVGMRVVHLPPHLIPDLQRHLDTFVPADCLYLFRNPKGEPLRRGSFASVWQRARVPYPRHEFAGAGAGGRGQRREAVPGRNPIGHSGQRAFRASTDDHWRRPGRLQPSKHGPFDAERATGIEPAQSVWKTETLPLSYARKPAPGSPPQVRDQGYRLAVGPYVTARTLVPRQRPGCGAAW